MKKNPNIETCYKLQQVSWNRCLLEINQLVILSPWQKGFFLIYLFEGATGTQLLLESSCFVQKTLISNNNKKHFQSCLQDRGC